MNSYRKIILIFLFLCSVCITAFADDTSDDDNIIEAKETEIFPSSDEKINDSSKCWQCRDVNDGYATKIIGFDFVHGVTNCEIYYINNLKAPLTESAKQENTACALDENVYQDKKTELEANIDLNSVRRESIISSDNINNNSSQLTMSQFLASLVTLNPNIIDREKTDTTGELTFKDGKEMYNVSSITRVSEDEKKNNIINFFAFKVFNFDDTMYTNTSALDGFNKNNMAYFSSLFNNMDTVYQHLQVFLFVLVGGFFVAQIGTNKLQTYLENRGENSGKQPYLHKFYIPLFMVGMFYMPIPEGTNSNENNSNYHASIMQNMIRYFATYSTSIADMANALGAKTYMNKIYTSVGGYSDAGILNIAMQYEQSKYIYEKSSEIYNTTCNQRYGKMLKTVSFSNLNSERSGVLEDFNQKIYIYDTNSQEVMDFNNVTGTKNDITLPTCLWLEMIYHQAKTDLNLSQKRINSMSNYQNNVAEKLNTIDEYFSLRNQQLGWIDAILLPSSGMLVELFTISDDTVESPDMQKSTESNRKNIQKSQSKGEIEALKKEANDSIIAWLSSKLVWMMLPGATAIKDFFQNNATAISTLIGGFVGGTAVTPAIPIPIIGSLLGTIVGSSIGAVIGSLSGTLLGYTVAVSIMQMTFEKIPLLVCTTASLVAFISYLVSLCKYFYISPFVVAFSMAQKRMDKIIDFLLSGISIFLKPVLIVLFIYLALFVHTLIDELFLFLAVEQFSGIKTNFWNVTINLSVGAITGLLTIFGKLAASYIMWKLIVSGPGWALGLVGIDGKHDDMIASGLEQNLARRAFVA